MAFVVRVGGGRGAGHGWIVLQAGAYRMIGFVSYNLKSLRFLLLLFCRYKI